MSFGTNSPWLARVPLAAGYEVGTADKNCLILSDFSIHSLCNGGNFQVGEGDTDHYCWQRPEDMTTSRRAYKVDVNNPGSDVAGETAAALAAASILFRGTNPHYSQLLLHHAQQVC